jgi:hypothetical protein
MRESSLMWVKVRRVTSGPAGRRPWRLWLLGLGLVLAALFLVSLLLSVTLLLLPYFLLAVAILLVVRWMLGRGRFGGKGPA